MDRIEKRVSEAVLQQPKMMTIGNKCYAVAPPSVATLILVSEAVSLLPNVKFDIKEDDSIVQPALSIARDCAAIGEVCAILILGAKGLSEVVKRDVVVEERHCLGLLKRKRVVQEECVVDKKSALAKELLSDHSPKELFDIITQILGTMQLGDFFATTTFLIEINLLRQTKVVEN